MLDFRGRNRRTRAGGAASGRSRGAGVPGLRLPLAARSTARGTGSARAGVRRPGDCLGSRGDSAPDPRCAGRCARRGIGCTPHTMDAAEAAHTVAGCSRETTRGARRLLCSSLVAPLLYDRRFQRRSDVPVLLRGGRMSARITLAFTSAMVAFGLLANATSVHADSPADLEIAAPPNAIVEQPRPFGYVIGDLLTQRVLLQLKGQPFEPGNLPRAERISAWLERRPPTVESTPDGRRWLIVEYQVVNAPQALTLAHVPAWELKERSATDVLRIGEWPISLSPLTPHVAFGQGGLEDLRPDRPTPSIATEPMRREIATWSTALILTLALWFGWWLWRNWRASATQPFASALREIRRTGEDQPAAWQALHRAFDRTAGRVTQTATLPNLFQSAPYLAPLRPNIEQFFQQSSERFFGAGLPEHTISVRALCAELRRLEKLHER